MNSSLRFSVIALAIGTCAASSALAGVNYGNLALSRSSDSRHFADIWDLTEGDLTLSYTINMNALHREKARAEVGLRPVGDRDVDPNTGGWMNSSTMTYGPTPNEFAYEDKHYLLALYERDEKWYDVGPDGTIGPIFSKDVSNGIWFDRDGIPDFLKKAGGIVEHGNWNTGGIYEIVITYHAINATLGTMFATVNGMQAGFYSNGWDWDGPDICPAGRSFTGDMTQMQVFAGFATGYTAPYGTAQISDLRVSQMVPVTPVPAPAAAGLCFVGLGLVGWVRRRLL